MIALISGGAQGIGRGVVQYFLQQGASVVATDIDAEAGSELLSAYRDLGKLHFVAADVSREAAVQHIVAETLETFGALDILVNNAGISANKPVTALSLEDWNRVIGTNLTAYFLMAKHAAPHLKRAHGAILNVASSRALMSEANTEAYSASKGGVVALSHALAISLGPEVRVNAVSPGWIEVRDWQKEAKREVVEHSDSDKAQHPVGRVGTPEDIARIIYFLATDKSGFITGQNIVVDGGMTKKMIYLD